MQIEVKYPIPHQKPSYATLYVNGVKLGEWIQGKSKDYENPKKWAAKQIKKRNKVINRNIARLKKELAGWKKEKESINTI